MPRINSTVPNSEGNTKYGTHGLNLNENTDWISPPRRLLSEGEIQMGCIDLDGSTVGKDGHWSITHLQRSDFIDGPDCFVDRNVSYRDWAPINIINPSIKLNANICPAENYPTSTATLRGFKSKWSSAKNHWLIQKHPIIKVFHANPGLKNFKLYF